MKDPYWLHAAAQELKFIAPKNDVICKYPDGGGVSIFVNAGDEVTLERGASCKDIWWVTNRRQTGSQACFPIQADEQDLLPRAYKSLVELRDSAPSQPEPATLEFVATRNADIYENGRKGICLNVRIGDLVRLERGLYDEWWVSCRTPLGTTSQLPVPSRWLPGLASYLERLRDSAPPQPKTLTPVAESVPRSKCEECGVTLEGPNKLCAYCFHRVHLTAEHSADRGIHAKKFKLPHEDELGAAWATASWEEL